MYDRLSPELLCRLTADERERLEFLRERCREEICPYLASVTQPLLMGLSISVVSIVPALLVFLWVDQIIPSRVATAGLFLDFALQIMVIWGGWRMRLDRGDRISRATRCHSDYAMALARKYGAR
jgi:hypothetical protein